MIQTIILFIFILGIIILVHETGHFLLAKKVGVHVYEFSIGMGPKLKSWQKKGKTKYSIRMIPIGGYVSLAGETNEKEQEVEKGKSLQDKTIFQRFLVMVMGATFNFLLAIIIFFMVALCCGGEDLTPYINDVTKDSPAYNAGLESNDKVLKINDNKIKYINDISLYLAIEDLSQEINIKVEKENKEIITYEVTPKYNEETNSYILGIVLQGEKTTGFIPAIKYAIGETNATFKQMNVVIKSLFTNKVSLKQLSGPVGIYSFVDETKSEGIIPILYLIALLSINIGFINLLPFPAFDGGRILFLIIEKIKGSPIKPDLENKIHTIGFLLILALMIYITFNDIFKLF